MNKYNLFDMNNYNGLSKDIYDMNAFGMYNSGIICYYNSAMQCLFSCPSFVYYVNSESYDNEMLHAIKIFLDKNNKPNYKPSYDLGLFNLFMSKIKNKFNKNSMYSDFGYNQEDCCEFITILLDVINDSFVYNLFKHTYKCKLFCLQCRKSKEINEDYGYIFNVSPKLIEKNCIKSKIAANIEEHSLVKYIRNNYSICQGVTCSECGSKEIIKTSQLLNVPSIILISLDKYNSKYMFEYPFALEFINRIEQKNKHIFKCVSTIHHNGNKNFGHYYSKCVRKDGWYVLNDISISKAESKESIAPENNVYVVAYHYFDSLDYF